MFKRIFLGYLTVLLVSFIVLALAFSITVRQYLINDTIASLHRVAETLSSSATQQNMQGGWHIRGAFFSLANRIAFADYLVLQDNGIVLDSSEQAVYPPGIAVGDDAFINLAFGIDAGGRLVTSERVAVAYPIRINGEETGAALILYTRPDLLTQLNRAISGILILALIAGIAVSLIAGALATRVVVKPMRQLKIKALELAGRRFDGKLTINTGDELEELADAFNEMSDRLAAYDLTQKDFFQKASHELKTPLMSIQGYAEAIKDGIIPPEEAEQSLAIIIKESQRMKTLVEQLIYVSKMEKMNEDYHPVKLDIDKAVEEAVNAVRSLTLERELSIEVKTLSKENYIIGDPEKIHRLMLNTLGNALRHSKGLVSITIEKGEIIIDDDGPGFKPGDENKVFDPFYTSDKGGSGLGLAISRAIAEKHSGSIRAENRPAGGARIIIKLPVHPANSATFN
ncbi:MAG: HAMP domain-containing sensor histidine kinase [Bacillota bacterium]|nr:HAMP domain-containing sensor histidine kinase [Bacillota bacterium]